MNSTLGILLFVGLFAAVLVLIYFVFRHLQRDHQTGEYHFTWAIGIVALFLLGFAPGFIGLGLYLTIEKGYPLYWLVVCLFVVLAISVFAGFGLYAVSVPESTVLASVP